jgi:hypothetical protein
LYLFLAAVAVVLMLLVVGQAFVRKAALFLGSVAALGSGVSEVSAQDVQFRPHAGLYLPTRISLQNGGLHIRQKIGVTVGARMTVTFNERFDVVTGVTYIPGYAVLRGAGRRFEVGTGSQQLSASTRARYWLLPPPRAFSWEVHTAIGMASGGRPAYEDLFDGSILTGVIGTTVRYQLGRIVAVQMRIQERLYRICFGGDPGRARPPLRVTFALSFPFLDLLRAVDPASEEHPELLSAVPNRF